MTGGRYLPIADYALIGDTRSAALVGRDGGIDWCCLPAFDSPSVFARILDDGRGGHFTVTVPRAEVTRRYLGDSMVLETTFRTPHGAATLTDAMPVAEAGGDWFDGPWILRLLRCVDGEVQASVRCTPAPFYAGERPPSQAGTDGFVVEHRLHASRRSLDEPDVTLHAGEAIVLAFGAPATDEPRELTVEAAEDALAATQAWWEDWAAQLAYEGDDRASIIRSALVLKALTSSSHGSMVAAPTASLPERIGGELNWDYRYAWLRDATLGFAALDALGCHDELAAYWRWIERATGRDAAALTLMYRMDGESELPESELAFSGYRDSRPVRIGNGAAHQLQLDTLGWALDAADRYSAAGGELSDESRRFIGDIADRAAEEWARPDAGIWEVRTGDQQLVYSKAMCWYALDRAIAIGERTGRRDDLEHWRASAEAIRTEVMTRGIDRELGRFVHAYGGTVLDASLLQLPRIGFVEASHPAMRVTIEVLRANLAAPDGLLYRNEYHGPKGFEGLFALVTFWLADCLIELDDLEGARQLVDRVWSYANDLGLMSEELDPETRAQLGNFPQAFSHTGRILTAVRLREAEQARRTSRG